MKTRSGFLLFVLFVLMGLTFCVKQDPQPAIVTSHDSIKVFIPPAPTPADTNTQVNNKPKVVIDPPVFNPNVSFGSVTDVEGNIYRTIQIGFQTWMAENLKTTKYNDGSPIYFGTGAPAGYTDWFGILKGAYCWYDNDAGTYKDAYGAIYNWHAVGTGKLCPAGWHIPDISEWITLITFLGGKEWVYGKDYENVTLDWGSSNDKLIASGFTPVNAGLLCSELSGWGFAPNGGIWWSVSTDSYGRYSGYNVPYADCIYVLSKDNELLYWLDFEPQSYGFSVRCLKD